MPWLLHEHSEFKNPVLGLKEKKKKKKITAASLPPNSLHTHTDTFISGYP